jgi:hypothetical protein
MTPGNDERIAQIWPLSDTLRRFYKTAKIGLLESGQLVAESDRALTGSQPNRRERPLPGPFFIGRRIALAARKFEFLLRYE